MAEDFLSEAELMAKWGIRKDALDKLVQNDRLQASEREGEAGFSGEQIAELEQAGDSGEFLGYDEAMQELQVSRDELEGMIGADKLAEYNFGSGPRVSSDEVQRLISEKKPTGLEKKPTDPPVSSEKEATRFEGIPLEAEVEAEAGEAELLVEAEPVEAEPVEAGNDVGTDLTGFDFGDELETEVVIEADEAGLAEAELVTDVMELAEDESAEEDLLGDIIEEAEDVEAPGAGEEDVLGADALELAGTGEVAAELLGEETAEPEFAEPEFAEPEFAEPELAEDGTAEITQLDEETFEGDDLGDILMVEDEVEVLGEEGAAFDVPTPLAAVPETEVAGLVIVLLAVVLLVQVVGGIFAIENSYSPDQSSSLTKWNPFLKK